MSHVFFSAKGQKPHQLSHWLGLIDPEAQISFKIFVRYKKSIYISQFVFPTMQHFQRDRIETGKLVMQECCE